MAESRKLVVTDAHSKTDRLAVEGPDVDGDFTFEMFSHDDVVTLDRAGLAELHSFLGKLLKGAE